MHGMAGADAHQVRTLLQLAQLLKLAALAIDLQG